jgi:ParB-like chromosome segregation protein Spo0J
MRELQRLKIGTVKTNGKLRGTPAKMEELKASMSQVGLLQSIIVDSKRNIVGGRRRHAAAVALEWTHIEAIICDTLDDLRLALLAEKDENVCRVPYLPSEIKALDDRIREQERQAAKARQAHGQTAPGRNAQATVAEALEKPGRVNDIVGAAAGVSGETVRRMNVVTETAAADPEGYGDLPAKMDEESVGTAYREKKRRDVQKAAKNNPGRFQAFADKMEQTGDVDAAWREMREVEKKGTTKGQEKKDALGQVIPTHLRDFFGDGPLIECMNSFEQMAKDFEANCRMLENNRSAYPYVPLTEIREGQTGILRFKGETIQGLLSRYATLAREGLPFAVHARCEGKGCDDCLKTGYVSQPRHAELKNAGRW